MKGTLPELPDAELMVMQALWSIGAYPAHSGEIAAKLERDWKAPTLLKLLSRLEERGFVQSEKEGRSNLYTPLVQEKDYLQAESRQFYQKLHRGSLSSLVTALYPEAHLTQKDLEALEQILNKGGN